MPRNDDQQSNLYSSYKIHCTCKVRIEITLSGAMSFVSDVSERLISDENFLKGAKLWINATQVI